MCAVYPSHHKRTQSTAVIYNMEQSRAQRNPAAAALWPISHQARCKALLQQQQHGASRQLQPHQSNKLALLSIPAFPVTRPHNTLMSDRKTDTHKPHSQTAMRHTAWQPPEGLLSCAQHTVNTAYLSTPSPHQIEHTEPNRCPILPSHLRTYNLTARTLLLLLLLPGS